MEPPPDARSRRVFVYGTLMPGRLRWPLIERAVAASEPAVVPGSLFDTGRGYPAACFGEPGEVPGWLLELEPGRWASTVELLDEVEGNEYRRIEVVTTSGRAAIAYDWIGPREGLTPLTTWSGDREA